MISSRAFLRVALGAIAIAFSCMATADVAAAAPATASTVAAVHAPAEPDSWAW